MMDVLSRVVRSCMLLAVLVGIVSCAGTPLMSSGPGGNRAMTSKADAGIIESNSRVALASLYQSHPVAVALSKKAEGVLVFPNTKNAGFLIGCGYADGALFEKGKRPSFYRSVTVNYGLHAGYEQHSYALFLMSRQAMSQLWKTGGWELGSEPNLTVLNRGFSMESSTTTVQKDIYAISFDHKGLMGGLKFKGTKVTRLNIQR